VILQIPIRDDEPAAVRRLCLGVDKEHGLQLALFEAAYTLTWWQGALSGCKENVLVLWLVSFEAAFTRPRARRFIRPQLNMVLFCSWFL
jgi:hypothetical protein